MTHLSNLQRDQLHGDAGTGALASLGTSGSVGRTINMNAEATVHQNASQIMITASSVNNAAGNWSAAGMYIRPPAGEPTPYRIKAYIQSKGAPGNTAGLNASIVIGTTASPINGVNSLADVLSFPIDQGYFDEVVLYTTVSPNDPVGVGLAVFEAAGVPVYAYISVQNMSIAAPQYSSSSS